MSIPRRHHFIPEFYLKQFTNEKGQFYIYLVNENKFKGKGKGSLFYPSQQFFEWDSNTIRFKENNDTTTFVENAYTKHDTEISDILKKINSGNENLSSYEWMTLQYFASIMHWRSPANVEKVKDYIYNSTSVKDFKMKLMSTITGEALGQEDQDGFLHKIKSEPEFYKFMKMMLPMITYEEIFERSVNDSATLITFPYGERLPKLVSDNPVIYRRPGNESIHRDEFILPLTPSKILVRHRNIAPGIHNYLKVSIDLMLMLQAKEYISCVDKRYPEALKVLYKNNFKSVEHLREYIFRNITGVTATL